MVNRTDKAATFVPLDKRLPFAFLASREWPAEYLQDLELQQQVTQYDPLPHTPLTVLTSS